MLHLSHMVADLCHFVLSCFWGEKAPRENPPMVTFSNGDLSPRHRKVQHFSCIAFSPPVCRIFAWRGEMSPRANPPNSENHYLAGFCVATFRPTRRKREKAPRENSPNGDFFVLSHGDLSPHHTKVRDIPCVAFSATVCRIFGGAKGRHAKTRQNHHLAGLRMATFRVFAMKTRLYDKAQISHHSHVFGRKLCVQNYQHR